METDPFEYIVKQTGQVLVILGDKQFVERVQKAQQCVARAGVEGRLRSQRCEFIVIRIRLL